MKLNFKNVTAIIIAVGITIFIAVYFTNSRHLNGKDSYLDEPTASSEMTPSSTVPTGQVSAAEATAVPALLDKLLDGQAGAEVKGPVIDPDRVYTEEWAEKKIEEHKDVIEQKDLEDFKNIIEEIGTRELSEDMKDGLSTEEQNKLYNEMKNTLTQDEYERARTLFEKYNWILSEE